MRTVQIELYKFDELAPDAQERVVERYREHQHIHGHFWTDEIWDSYNALIKHIGTPPDSDEFDLRRSLAWLENHVLEPLRVGWTGKKRKDYRRYGQGYRAGQIKPCPFTGVCFDDALLYFLVKEVKDGANPRSAVRWLAEERDRLIEAEVEHQSSDAYIREELEVKEAEYTRDGGEA